MGQPPRRIFTIGHSTRPIEVFLGLLAGHGVERLLDVRTVPRSRHNPQYSSDALTAALAAAGLGYRHLPGLGGLRRPSPGSVNTGWRNLGFRGYADYMQTPAFEESLEQCIEISRTQVAALMCAEAVPWRCHRSLIADALLVRGIEVLEITGVDAGAVRPHALAPFARVEGTRVTYPSA